MLFVLEIYSYFFYFFSILKIIFLLSFFCHNFDSIDCFVTLLSYLCKSACEDDF